MTVRFLIRWLADGNTEWMASAGDGSVVQGPSAGLPSGTAEEVVLLLPGESVLLLKTPRVGRSRSQWAKAVPFAIEDQLAAPIEQQHVAFAECRASNDLTVAVVDRELLQRSLAALSAAGLSATECFAETQLMPVPTGACQRLDDGARVLLRWAEDAALVVARDEIAELDAWLDEQGVPTRPELAAEAEGFEPALKVLARHLASASPPNLLQGVFQPRGRRLATQGAWRWAMGLAAGLLVLSFTALLIERNAYRRQGEARENEMAQLLRQAVPGTTRIVDPVAQLEAALDRAGTQDRGALPLLTLIAPALTGSGRFTLEALDYNAGTLDLTLTAPDVATLDALREQIATLSALSVEVTSSIPGSRGVEGRLRIREASP